MDEHTLDTIIRELMSEEPVPSWHKPVLIKEIVSFLAPESGSTIVDCTVGTGGHSLAILPHLMPTGRIVAIDCDAQALERARERLAEFNPQVRFIHDNFRHLPEILGRLRVTHVHGLVADLGVSSLHLDWAERGFSFQKDGPLDMRMDTRQSTTAAALIRRLSEPELVRILEVYGEERWARRIAKRIVVSREAEFIKTTTQLARVVAEAIPGREASRRIHPATRTFLALRIAVNEELAALEELLAVLPKILAPGGRAVFVTFHSLEDRLVKHAFRQGAQAGLYRLLTKKPVYPTEVEIADNPRSRSAKLRVVERLE